MGRMRFSPVPGQMGGVLTEVPLFTGDAFHLGIPEAIGDAARALWPNAITPEWEELGEGAWRSAGRRQGELSYTATIAPGEDAVDIEIALTNESDRPWLHSLAFNCFGCGGSVALSDHECVRHWVRASGAFRRLIELPRKLGPRPTIQLYSVEGAPPGGAIPFVAGFRATPDVLLEGWMAIRSRDGKRMVAAASKPALFLFQNMEYSCIHSAPGLGALHPGQIGKALTRLYFVEAPLGKWHERMRAELG